MVVVKKYWKCFKYFKYDRWESCEVSEKGNVHFFFSTMTVTDLTISHPGTEGIYILEGSTAPWCWSLQLISPHQVTVQWPLYLFAALTFQFHFLQMWIQGNVWFARRGQNMVTQTEIVELSLLDYTCTDSHYLFSSNLKTAELRII